MDKKIALKIHDIDNVATLFVNGIEAGMDITVRDKKGNEEVIKSSGAIPYGHKIAVRDIQKGELIMKYGEEIGGAIADIKKGDYVHDHNVESLRGRGDL